MFQIGSPEHAAFELAGAIDKGAIIDAVEAAGFARVLNECHFVNRELSSILEALTIREKVWIDGRYPALCTAAWFDLAQATALSDCSTTIGVACERYRQELDAELGSGTMLRSNEELRTTLQRIAKAEKLLADALGDLRREASRPGQAATSRGAAVRNLYHSVQQTILTSLGFPLDPGSGESPLATIEIKETAYFGKPPVLERALLRASKVSEGLADNHAFWARLPQARIRINRARERWILDIVGIWETATGLPATFTGDPPSAFYIWSRCAHGHLVGLLREFGDGDTKDQRVRERARHYRIHPIPSARTLKTAFDNGKKMSRRVKIVSNDSSQLR